MEISADQKATYQGYREEAVQALSEVEAAMTHYKDIVTAASETTNLSKRDVGKAFKAYFEDKIKSLSEEADIIEFLNE